MDTAWETLLKDPVPLRAPALLRLGLHCYALKVGQDRLLIWRQIRVAPPGNVLRISFFDTTLLQPINRKSRRRAGDPVIYESGLLDEADLPSDWEVGRHTYRFPDSLRNVPDILALVHSIQGWSPVLPRPEWKARRLTSIYVVKPSRSEVEVLLLDWARSIEGHFHWIARVARDPTTRNIVGDGAGVRLFLLTDSGKFLGWIRTSNSKA